MKKSVLNFIYSKKINLVFYIIALESILFLLQFHYFIIGLVNGVLLTLLFLLPGVKKAALSSKRINLKQASHTLNFKTKKHQSILFQDAQNITIGTIQSNVYQSLPLNLIDQKFNQKGQASSLSPNIFDPLNLPSNFLNYN
eukprot:COSAG01_NODE_52_length_31456_cov_125.226648_6_plen_141_part_00